MGESYTLPIPGFNGSVRIEARAERLTAEAGALPVREGLERLGLLGWLDARLVDSRNPELITHPYIELLTTSVLMMALGWRDQDDADTLRDDPALRLAVSTRRGISPLNPAPPTDDGRPRDDRVPHGLASQPTLSRMVDSLSSEHNRTVLREGLVVGAGRRIRASNGGQREAFAMLDIDSLPIEVHGHQTGAEYNGHYHHNIFHPIVASLGGHGDLVDVQLRHGKAHTAEGGLEFILPLLDDVEREVAHMVGVRMDAGYPSEPLLAGLEEREPFTWYVARVRNNAVLDRMAAPSLKKAPLCPLDAEPQTWMYEHTYRAGSWSRSRRVVLVVQQRPGELLAKHFWLLTSWGVDEMPADELLELYRQRGSAEKLMGEWVNTLRPALSSVARAKSHYQGKALDPNRTTLTRDHFAVNEVTLLLTALAYNAMHLVRTLVERTTGRGWGLAQVREQVLKTAARVVVHARYVTVIVTRAAARIWQGLWRNLARIGKPPLQTAS